MKKPYPEVGQIWKSGQQYCWVVEVEKRPQTGDWIIFCPLSNPECPLHGYVSGFMCCYEPVS